MLEQLKEQVYRANMLLPEHRLVTFTWGNVSGVDRESGIMAIKPSGVEYEKLSPEDMVLVDIRTGKKVEGKWNPSSDTATHCELYRSFEHHRRVVHTHSRWATIFSQMGRGVPAWHHPRDYFYGEIPCTRKMTPEGDRPGVRAGDGQGHCGDFQARTRRTSPRCWCTATAPLPGAATP